MALVRAVLRDLAVRHQMVFLGPGAPGAEPRLLTVGLRQGFQFLLRRGDIRLILRRSLQAGVSGRRQEYGRFHVALPVITRNHAALTPFITGLEQRVLPLGMELRKDQGHTPAADGVARRIGTAPAGSFLFPGNQCSFPIKDIRTQAHIGRLGPGGAKPEGADAAVQQVEGLRRLLPGEFPAKGAAEHRRHRIHVRGRFPDGADAALPFPAGLSPLVLGLVIFELGRSFLRRRRKEDDGVGDFFDGQIGFYPLPLGGSIPGKNQSHQKEGG